jgi:hypothetical protein
LLLLTITMLLLLLLVPWLPAASAVLVPAGRQGQVRAMNEQLRLLSCPQGLLPAGAKQLKRRAAEAGPGERGLPEEHTRERWTGCEKHLRHLSLEDVQSAAY